MKQKALLLIVWAALATLLLCACSHQNEPTPTTDTSAIQPTEETGSATEIEPTTGEPTDPQAPPSCQEITDAVFHAVSFPEMVALNDKRLELFYFLDLDQVEDYSVFMSAESTCADELAVIKAKSGCASFVLEAVKQRISDQQSSLAGYLPEQAKRVEEGALKVAGDYVFFAVCDDPSAAQTAFETLLED